MVVGDAVQDEDANGHCHATSAARSRSQGVAGRFTTFLTTNSLSYQPEETWNPIENGSIGARRTPSGRCPRCVVSGGATLQRGARRNSSHTVLPTGFPSDANGNTTALAATMDGGALSRLDAVRAG